MYRGRMYCRSGGLHSGFSPEAKMGSSSALFVPICFGRECGYGFDREMGLVLHWDDVWCGPSEQEEFSAYISEAPRKEFGRVSQQPILISSRDSRIPPRRPSMIGRIPILGWFVIGRMIFGFLFVNYRMRERHEIFVLDHLVRKFQDQVVSDLFQRRIIDQVALFAGIVPQVV